MVRFDYYANPDREGYFLIIQSHRIKIQKTRVVVPLIPKKKMPSAADKLHPVFQIGDQDFVMATHLMSAVSTRDLKHHVGSLAHKDIEIMDALDMLFSSI